MHVTVDLQPLVDQVVIPILSSLLLAFAAWALNRLAALAHFKLQDGQRVVVANAITNGIALAQKTLAPNEAVNVDVQVAKVLGYVIPKVPGALKSLGVTPDHLAEVVKAQLPGGAP